MIRITNCFKIEPDLDKVSEEEWRQCTQEGSIDLGYIKSRINLQDEGALELSLRFRDSAAAEGMECALSAVSGGGNSVISTLQTLAALGFTRTDRIDGTDDFNPELTGAAIAEYLKVNEKQELIVCGGQSGTGSSRAVPLYIAHRLGILCITNVKDFTPADEDTVRVVYHMDGTDITDTVKMPVVLAVGDVQQAYLRVPTLKQRMASASQQIGHYTECSGHETQMKLKGFRYIEQTRNTEIVDGTNPEEGASVIYSRLKQEGMVE